MPFTNTWPAWSPTTNRCCSSSSLVHTLEPSPNSVPLARASASSASAAVNSRATGPNTSSVATRMAGVMPVITVGR